MDEESNIKSPREIAERKARWRAEDKGRSPLRLAELAGDRLVKAPLNIARMKTPLNEDT
ncbi:MAG: hypothetical protein ACPGVU_26065 [Limisphaerales bacterium]